MRFNEHSDLEGQHAFLSASSYHWLNYDDEKLRARWLNAQAARRGTELHDFAHQAIRLRRRQPKTKDALNRYVNDGIGFRMKCEQVLCYSENAFGTADTIAFEERQNTLRIHDLKTGAIPGKIEQLRVYAALFCLEYGFRPGELEIILRIYQDVEVLEEKADVDDIAHIISKIVVFDDMIRDFKRFEG